MDAHETTPPREPESQPDDFQVEVSDLDMAAQPRRAGPARSGGQYLWSAPWYRRRVELPQLAFVAALIVLVMLTVLALPTMGNQLAALGAHPTLIATSNGQLTLLPTPLPATPTPSPYPTPTLVAPAIGPVPNDCPPGATLTAFDPAATGPGVGSTDVWLYAGAFLGPHGDVVDPHATAHLGTLRPSDYTEYGWPVQVLVLVKPGLSQVITATGFDLHTGFAPFWLTPETEVNETVAPTITIDPSQLQSFTSDGQWKIWFGIVYLPGAGCYVLHADWAGGGWQAFFAAGR
ncbi:MAG TPA: hypothetical protein VGS80_22405 [Ktedonobacterales bacterium]|nr:hypothetical protein [Ktedonobacterales bacterium]